MSERLSKTNIYFIDLLRALVHGESIPAPYEGVDLMALYAVSESQGLSSMLYHALYRLKLDESDEKIASAMERFRGAHKAYVKHSVMQEVEYLKLSAALDQSGIEYCPLKGWYTRELYPESVMRYLADLDILIHSEDTEKVNAVMTKLGYSCRDLNKHDDDKYRKAGLAVEMHRTLDTDGLKDASLYEKPFELTEPVGGGCRRMRDSDAYLYTVVHGMKHFMFGGTGIRSLLDIYLYLKNAKLDESYIKECAERMGVTRFLNRMEELAVKVFGSTEAGAVTGSCEKDLDADSEELVYFMLKSGAGGSRETLDASLFDRSGKGGRNGSRASYIFRNVFPSMKSMQKRDPVLKKAPALLPVMYVRRWFQLLFSKRERLRSGIERYNSIDGETVEKLKRIHELAGLE